MGTSIGIGTMRGRNQFPSGTRFFLLLPRNVAAEQIQRINLLRESAGGRLRKMGRLEITPPMAAERLCCPLSWVALSDRFRQRRFRLVWRIFWRIPQWEIDVQVFNFL